MAGQKRSKQAFQLLPSDPSGGAVGAQGTYCPLGPCHHSGGTDGAGLGSMLVGLEDQREGRSRALSAMGSLVTQARNFLG